MIYLDLDIKDSYTYSRRLITKNSVVGEYSE